MLSLDLDLTPLWTSVQDNFPFFLSILAIPAGITIAVMIASFIINEVKRAF